MRFLLTLYSKVFPKTWSIFLHDLREDAYYDREMAIAERLDAQAKCTAVLRLDSPPNGIFDFRTADVLELLMLERTNGWAPREKVSDEALFRWLYGYQRTNNNITDAQGPAADYLFMHVPTFLKERRVSVFCRVCNVPIKSPRQISVSKGIMRVTSADAVGCEAGHVLFESHSEVIIN